jgi:NADPH:quinone reductase-like Zn-dependent oxidoreductase
MKAIVATDQNAEAAGIKLTQRPEPTPAINDVVVEVHASGFVPAEWEWPSTWTDRAGHARDQAIVGHEFAGVVTALGYGTTGLSASGSSGSRTGTATEPWPSTRPWRRATSRRCRETSGSRWVRACRSPA